MNSPATQDDDPFRGGHSISGLELQQAIQKFSQRLAKEPGWLLAHLLATNIVIRGVLHEDNPHEGILRSQQEMEDTIARYEVVKEQRREIARMKRASARLNKPKTRKRTTAKR